MTKVYMESNSLLLHYKIVRNGKQIKCATPIFAASDVIAEDIVNEYKHIGRELVGDESSSIDTQKALIWDKENSPIMKTLRGESDDVVVYMRFDAFENIAKNMFKGAERLAEYLIRERDRYNACVNYRKQMLSELSEPVAIQLPSVQKFYVHKHRGDVGKLKDSYLEKAADLSSAATEGKLDTQEYRAKMRELSDEHDPDLHPKVDEHIAYINDYKRWQSQKKD